MHIVVSFTVREGTTLFNLGQLLRIAVASIGNRGRARRLEGKYVQSRQSIRRTARSAPEPPFAPVRSTPVKSPIEGLAWRGALGATGVVALAAGLGGVVRLLPWLLDPAVTFRLAAPFARGLAALACEAALVVGWPVGWAIATMRVVERGEARALATLGESAARTVLRLAPQGLALACALGFVSFVGGREASEPGRVVTDLIARGREACLGVTSDATYVVPFASATWLCSPSAAPRLVGRAPGTLSGSLFTAGNASAAGDLREIDLHDAHLVLGGARVQVGLLRLRGLLPFAHASRIPPFARALSLVLAAAFASSLTALQILEGAIRGRFAALSTSAAGPIVALGALRAVESGEGPWIFTALAPIAALVAVALISNVLSRLPPRMRAASR